MAIHWPTGNTIGLLSSRAVPTKRLFCYVDESGQDTLGQLFVVSVVIALEDRDALRQRLEQIEAQSGKRRRKWSRTRHDARLAYLHGVLKVPLMARTLLCYEGWRKTKDYPRKTVLTVARAISHTETDDYRATIFVDGLHKEECRWFAGRLRDLGILTKKVRGVHTDEADALMRLADALCGFVRAGLAGEPPYQALLLQATQQALVRNLTP